MPNAENMEYDLKVTFRVTIKKWRVDDQSIDENREWSLSVFDRNLGRWVNVMDLKRPGEKALLWDVEPWEEGK